MKQLTAGVIWRWVRHVVMNQIIFLIKLYPLILQADIRSCSLDLKIEQ